MSQRYRIRVYESADEDCAVTNGAVVAPIERSFTIYAYSAEEAQTAVQNDVSKGKLPSGRVYQICPWLGNPELIRSIAASQDGSFQRVFLDPAFGLYGEFRRIRFAKPSPAARQESFAEQAEYAKV
ncbi:MAG: hypothetical protein JO097_10145 [Acidobacteriaceae bacterium]|nr:hypothetical protein [Acidobacteriaceae bacterium]MBV9295126.1 hypothetical protein [Acidobacteriaceae bacterium]MBV9765677.1 hypothetical protein [Acidobacteriaceae bacterium]